MSFITWQGPERVMGILDTGRTKKSKEEADKEKEELANYQVIVIYYFPFNKETMKR